MKTKTQFICELCGSVYDEPVEAIECEKSHIKPVIDGPVDPKPEYRCGMKYPMFIKIGFEDGEVKKYSIER